MLDRENRSNRRRRHSSRAACQQTEESRQKGPKCLFHNFGVLRNIIRTLPERMRERCIGLSPQHIPPSVSAASSMPHGHAINPGAERTIRGKRIRVGESPEIARADGKLLPERFRTTVAVNVRHTSFTLIKDTYFRRQDKLTSGRRPHFHPYVVLAERNGKMEVHRHSSGIIHLCDDTIMRPKAQAVLPRRTINT